MHGSSEKASSLGRLLRTARLNGLLPPAAGPMDHFNALLMMRNALAHGTLEVHTPEMSLTVLFGCAEAINQLYAASGPAPLRGGASA